MKEINVNPQYFATLVVSMMGINYGIMCGWSSPAIFLFLSDKSPLSTGSITVAQASWISSLNLAGMMFTSIFVGSLTNKYGRKWPLILLSIPSTISWALIYSAKNVYFLYTARIIQGFVAAGTFSFGQLYLIEISNYKIRGALSSSLLLASNFGIVVAFIIGTYFAHHSTHSTALFAIAINALFVGSFLIFPESPIFLLRKNQIEDAEESIQFFQNIDVDDRKSIDKEIERLKRQIGDDDGTTKSVSWSELLELLLRNPGKKAIIIGMVLSLLTHFSGNFVLMNYTANIFKFAGSMLHPNESALIVAVIQFIATCVVPLLVERTGRKPLYIVSTVGSTLGLSVLGVYVMLEEWHYHVESFSWISIVSVSATVSLQALAISSLSITVASEILPENLREFGLSFCNTVLAAGGFVVLKFSPDLCAFIGLHGAFFLFGGICIFSTLFIICYVPEPKGKNYDEVMQLLE